MGFHFLSPGDLPDPGIEPRSPTLQADILLSEPPGKPASASHLLDAQKILAFVELCASKQRNKLNNLSKVIQLARNYHEDSEIFCFASPVKLCFLSDLVRGRIIVITT